jgi:DNA-binding NarL/FixJ family response regulator
MIDDPTASVLSLGHLRKSASAIIVLCEAKAEVSAATLVQALFDLTPAEIGVARAIASGRSISEIPRDTGRSVTTVRNRLKSAM